MMQLADDSSVSTVSLDEFSQLRAEHLFCIRKEQLIQTIDYLPSVPLDSTIVDFEL